MVKQTLHVFSQITMCAVTERLLGAVLAATQKDLASFFDRERHGRKRGAFV